jgi:hypothetical protein
VRRIVLAVAVVLVGLGLLDRCSTRGRAALEQGAHAVSVGSPYGGDGALEDFDETERGGGVERREMDLRMARSAARRHEESLSRQCGRSRTRLSCSRSTDLAYRVQS